ncbi:MAG: right-handed parallel beta-helix repeat-containing protein [Candidatus Methylomirabilia bacterium]
MKMKGMLERSISRQIAAAAVTGALLFATARPASAESPAAARAPTTIESDTIWEGRVVVEAPLSVPAGVTLTVRPGVTVLFRGGAGITVFGVLRAEGTSDQPVTFSADGDAPWAGIAFAAGEQPSRLYGCRITAARALTISAGEHVIEQSDIAGGTLGIEVTGDATRPILRGNRIHEMREGGIRCVGKSAPLVEDNIIESCGPFGVHASQGASPLVQRNTVVNCTSGIELFQTAPFIRDNLVRQCARGIALSAAGGGKPVQGNTAENCVTGIFIQQFSSPEIQGNVVVKNKDGILCDLGARPLIRNNRIRDNETGISCNQIATPTIEANAIEHNRRGIFLTLSSYAVVRGNNIDGNGIQMELGNMSLDWERRAGNKPQRGRQKQAAIRSGQGTAAPGAAAGSDGLDVSGGAVEAGGNWWGEATTREMEQKGADADISGLRDWHDVPTLTYEGFAGEYVQDRIAYAPWAKERIAAAGPPSSTPAAGNAHP